MAIIQTLANRSFHILIAAAASELLYNINSIKYYQLAKMLNKIFLINFYNLILGNCFIILAKAISCLHVFQIDFSTSDFLLSRHS